MTAYGKSISNSKQSLIWTVEVHYVNRKFLDINLNLPKELLHLDIDIRKRINKQISRGQVSVKIGYKKTKDY